MPLNSQASVGTVCVVVFVLSTAIRDVHFGGVFQATSVFAVLLVAFGIATAAGLGLAAARPRGGLRAVLTAPRDALAMNLTTGLAWCCYFFALKLLEPAIANTLFAGIAPFVMIGLNRIGVSIAAPVASSLGQKLSQLGAFAALIALVIVVATEQSGIGASRPETALVGAGLAFVGGASIAISLMFCKRLNEAGASPEALLGTRFFGLIAIAVIGLSLGDSVPSASDALALAPAALLLIVAPVYLQQIGIARIGPLNAKIIATLGPVLVFLMQQVDERIAWSTPTLVAILAYSVCAMAANFVQRRSYVSAAAPVLPA